MKQDTHLSGSNQSMSLRRANQLTRAGAYGSAVEIYKRLKAEAPGLRAAIDFNLNFCARRAGVQGIEPSAGLAGGGSTARPPAAHSANGGNSWESLAELGAFPGSAWRAEFGPGRVDGAPGGRISLQTEGERHYFSHELLLEAGYRYKLSFRIRRIAGAVGEVAAIVVPEHRITLGAVRATSCGIDGLCELQFFSEEPVKARVRVGIGTTAAVQGNCMLEVECLEISRRKFQRETNPDLSAFARNYIDAALHLPQLRGLGNDYSHIEEKANSLRTNSRWEKLKVSVIVPGYRRAHLLRNTLAALSRQDYPRDLMQVILVDDGSDDDEYEKVFFEFDKHFELYLCRQKRCGYGLSRARNMGARLATGEVLFFLDSDILLPEAFVSSIMSFHHVSDAVSVLGIRKFVNAEQIVTEDLMAGQITPQSLRQCRSLNPHHRHVIDEGGGSFDWRLTEFARNDWLKRAANPFRYFGGGHSSVSRVQYCRVGGYDESFSKWGNEDQEFAYRLWTHGQYFIPLKGIFDYHQEDSSASEDQRKKLVENQQTHRLLVDRCPHPSVRGFTGLVSDAVIPQFSIYILAFNTAKYIQECVDSALAQTYRDFEVVIVDDGSTDDTWAVLQSFRHHPRVRITRKLNGGIGSASNAALQACRGEYVVQLDSDDLLRPNALQTVAEHLATNPNIECLYTRYTVIDEASRIIGPGWSPARFDRYENLIGMSVPHMRVFRRALYHRTGGFDESIVNAVDYDFYLKLSEVTEIHFLDSDLYLYRVHATQTSNAKRVAQIRNHSVVVERHLERLGLNGFRVTNSNPFEPRRNYIARAGSEFDRELSERTFEQPAIEGGLSLPEPQSSGNDYSAIQELVRSIYTQKAPPPYTEKVSIVVPVYNRAERLSRCLAGIFNQSYPRDLIEVVVVDDGSSDEVMTVVRKYSDLLDIQYVKQADLGYRLSAARNAGIRSARFRNISIIDCDLIPLRGFIESFMKYLHHFDNVVLLGHQRFVDPTGISDDDILTDPEVLGSMREIQSENSTMREGAGGVTVDWRYALYEETDHLKTDQFPYRAFSSGHVAYRKDLIERAGMYDEDFAVWGCEDNEAGYRLYQAGAFFIPVLEAVDLHQEPPGGKNETDREAHRKLSRHLLQEKVPATRGWFGPGFERKPGMVPLVTIGIPIHNTGSLAIDAVRSALAQDMRDLEVLAYDDASTDGTLQLLADAFEGDPRVRIISAPDRRNVTYARNEIIKHARGEFVGFLDSDDLLESSCVRQCVTAFRANSKLGLVCTDYSRIAEDGTPLGAGWSPSKFDREALMFGNIFTHFRMFRVRDWSRCRKWDGLALKSLGYGEDWDLCLMLAEVSQFARIPQPLYKYRVRSSGITQSSSHEYKAAQTKLVIQRWLNRLGRSDLTVVSTSRTNPSSIGFVKSEGLIS